MLIGLDVGGTNTDAVLISREGKYIRGLKVPTSHEAIINGILSALEKLLEGVHTKKIQRLCVSSTLALNALLTGKTDPVGLLLISGPGLSPQKDWLKNPLIKLIDGAQNHLGIVTAHPSEKKVISALKKLKAEKVKAIGIAVKFSPKNPELELWLENISKKYFPNAPIVLGSRISSALNFPRRVNTVWLQAALSNINTDFIASLEKAMPKLGLSCPLSILKADSGTYASYQAAKNPADSIGSGPAASLLGLAASTKTDKDCIMLSLGGTSTDIAFLLAGEALLLREGMIINGKPTLIRALNTHSIAIGGDSSLSFTKVKPGRKNEFQSESKFQPESRSESESNPERKNTNPSLLAQKGLKAKLGPQREGPALINAPEDLGKRPPTFTDALSVLGLYESDNKNLAKKAIEKLMQDAGISGISIEEMAHIFLNAAMEKIKNEVDHMVQELNSKPVYTIREIQHAEKITPQEIVLIGGPAPALAKSAEKIFKLPACVPENSGLSNALGAALARPTAEAELYADTQLKKMQIPSCGLSREINSSYTAEDAKADLIKALNDVQQKQKDLKDTEDTPVQILYAETFHTLTASGERGKIIKAKAQLAPGLL